MQVMQALRDLRWLLLSPPLLNPNHPRFAAKVFEFSKAEQALIEQWLLALEQSPAPLAAWLAEKPAAHIARLGRYAEHLLEYFLRFGPTHRLIAANVPIRTDPESRVGDNTTVGEIDYLLEDRQGTRWHWELAVKYFLCSVADPQSPSSIEPAHFIGPDGAERFDLKLDKLFNRQLLNRPPADWMPVAGSSAWRSAAFTRGWLFYPPSWRAGNGRDDTGSDAIGPDTSQINWTHPAHLRGSWLTVEQWQAQRLSEPANASGEKYVLLDRQQWMARGFSTSAMSAQELLERCQAYWSAAQLSSARWGAKRLRPGPSGLLVAQVRQDGRNPPSWSEVARFFLLPDDLLRN